MFVHGRAEFVPQAHPDWQEIEDHLTAHYGSSPTSWGDDIVYLRVTPHWMVAYAAQPAKLLKEVEGSDA